MGSVSRRFSSAAPCLPTSNTRLVLWPWWTQPRVPLMLQMFRTWTNVCRFSGFTTKNCVHWCSVFLGWVVWKVRTSEIKRPMFSSQLCHLQAWSRSLTHSEFLPHSKHPRNIIFPFHVVPVISLCTPDHMSCLKGIRSIFSSPFLMLTLYFFLQLLKSKSHLALGVSD